MADDKKNIPDVASPTEAPAPTVEKAVVPEQPAPEPALTDAEVVMLEHEGQAALFEMGEAVPDPADAVTRAEVEEPAAPEVPKAEKEQAQSPDPGKDAPAPERSGKVVDFAAARDEAAKEEKKAVKQKPPAEKDKAAIDAAKAANITIFTIGLGKYIDAEYLYSIAEQTNGQFFQASNADALENIYEKIQSFMSYNQVTFEEESGTKGYIVADSGFNVLKDGIGYNNFRSDFAPNGADVGIAGLIRDYYDGTLEMSREGYTTADGTEIPGYDISSISGITDGKADLNSVELGALASYNEYIQRSDKWNYRSIKGGTLHYTSDTRAFIDEANLKVITSHYDYSAPEQSGFMKFLRTITFNKIKDFTDYECVLIDSKNLQGDDLAIMNMLRWYCAIPDAADKCNILDFGYNGDEAFDKLINELTTGTPALITYGSSAMNAIRIIRDEENPDLFVIDAYDSNSPERSTRITLRRTPVYDGDTIPTYQYSASRGSVTEPLRIIVEK